MLKRHLPLTLIIAFVLPTAYTAPKPPSLAQELRACEKIGGTAPALPAATDYPGGISPKAGALTPAELPGAITVSPKTAACLIDAMGSELVVMAPMSDPEGIEDAWTLPGAGTGKALTDEEQRNLANFFKAMTGDRKDRPVLAYCHHTSCFLSYNALIRMRDAGYTNLLWMREGIKGWKAAGLPVGLTRKISSKQFPDVSPRVRKDEHYDINYPSPHDYYGEHRYAPLKGANVSAFKLCDVVRRDEELKTDSDDYRPELYYTFQPEFYAAAGIDPDRDNEVAIRRKMQAFWARYGDLLECKDPGWTGSISVLKAAAAHKSPRFLEAAIFTWRLPLNKVDLSDGRTLLDLVEDEYNRYIKVDVYRPMYEKLYKQLRKAGAMHRAELEAAGKWKSRQALRAEFLPTYRQAAERGDIYAMFHLSRVYRRGLDVPVNHEEGMRWWTRAEQRAIETRNYHSMVHNIGLAFYKLQGIPLDFPEDPERAVTWFRRAADANYEDGLVWLGRAYLHGTGVPKDVRRGIGLMERGFAMSGDAITALWIARGYYELGDMKTLPMWLRVAPPLMEVGGMWVEQWFEKKGIPLCGPRPKPYDPIPCDGQDGGSLKKVTDQMTK